ncbi:MAG: glycosyltransferase family 4 protein [Candidatus Hodarchaeota archaeon]
MKIVHLTSGHGLDSRIFHKELDSLKKISSNITYVLPEQLNTKEINGIRICGYKTSNTHKYLRRFMNVINLYKNAKELCIDIIHCHEPDSLFVGYILKKKFKCKLIYDSHEYHPEAFAERVPIIFKWIMEKIVFYIEKFLVKNTDYIVTVNELLVEKFKKDNPNVISIPNYPKLELLNLKDDENDKKIDFIYIGRLARMRGISKIIEASQILKRKNIIFNVHFIGEFCSNDYGVQINTLINKYNLNNDITFHGYIEYGKIHSILKKAKAGLVLLQPDIYRYTICEPTKLFEYMGNGLPIIANNYDIVRNIILANDCGILVDPTDPTAIAKAMEEILKNPKKWNQKGKNGIKAIKEKYNWEIFGEKLRNVYRELEVSISYD